MRPEFAHPALAEPMSPGMWLFVGDFTGTVAMWAVKQSPYSVPDNLEVVIRKFHDAIRPAFDEREMRQFSSWGQVEALVREALREIPEYLAWNEPRREDAPDVQFTSRYSAPVDPDDDFIDLDALERNVANSIVRQYIVDSDETPDGNEVAEIARTTPDPRVRGSGTTHKQLSELQNGDVFVVGNNSMKDYVRGIVSEHFPDLTIKVRVLGPNDLKDLQRYAAGWAGRVVLDHALADHATADVLSRLEERNSRSEVQRMAEAGRVVERPLPKRGKPSPGKDYVQG